MRSMRRREFIERTVAASVAVAAMGQARLPGRSAGQCVLAVRDRISSGEFRVRGRHPIGGQRRARRTWVLVMAGAIGVALGLAAPRAHATG